MVLESIGLRRKSNGESVIDRQQQAVYPSAVLLGSTYNKFNRWCLSIEKNKRCYAVSPRGVFKLRQEHTTSRGCKKYSPNVATSDTDTHIQVCHGDKSHAHGSHAANKVKPLIYKKGDTAIPSEPRDRRHQHQS